LDPTQGIAEALEPRSGKKWEVSGLELPHSSQGIDGSFASRSDRETSTFEKMGSSHGICLENGVGMVMQMASGKAGINDKLKDIKITDSNSSKLVAPRHAFVSTAAFRLSAKEAKIYALEILECSSMVGVPEPLSTSIPFEYNDL